MDYNKWCLIFGIALDWERKKRSIEHKTDGKNYLFSTDRPETYTHRSYTGQWL